MGNFIKSFTAIKESHKNIGIVSCEIIHRFIENKKCMGCRMLGFKTKLQVVCPEKMLYFEVSLLDFSVENSNKMITL